MVTPVPLGQGARHRGVAETADEMTDEERGELLVVPLGLRRRSAARHTLLWLLFFALVFRPAARSVGERAKTFAVIRRLRRQRGGDIQIRRPAHGRRGQLDDTAPARACRTAAALRGRRRSGARAALIRISRSKPARSRARMWSFPNSSFRTICEICRGTTRHTGCAVRSCSRRWTSGSISTSCVCSTPRRGRRARDERSSCESARNERQRREWVRGR